MNLSNLLRRWRALTHREELDDQLDDELRFHLEKDIEQNIRNGMSPGDARYAALKAFGAVDQSKEECRDARGVAPLENTRDGILNRIPHQQHYLVKAIGCGERSQRYSVKVTNSS